VITSRHTLADIDARLLDLDILICWPDNCISHLDHLTHGSLRSPKPRVPSPGFAEICPWRCISSPRS
jgi:hypothetical protein